MAQSLDYFFTGVHTIIIGFSLLGWIWPVTRKPHFIVVMLITGSWLILGIWYGLGYCPITDWQWQLKEQLGETNLPNSFIKYYADKISGQDVPATLVDSATAIGFTISVVLSVYMNFFKKVKE